MDIKDQIVKVALGKAQVVTLTDKGVVYTFGINNKGQYGRDVFSSSQPKQQSGNSEQLPSRHRLRSRPLVKSPLTMKSKLKTVVRPLKWSFVLRANIVGVWISVWSVRNVVNAWYLISILILWLFASIYDIFHILLPQGFGPTCVNTSSPGRFPGTFCRCGFGEPWCTVCGVCRTCARIQNADALGLPPAPVPILSWAWLRDKYPNSCQQRSAHGSLYPRSCWSLSEWRVSANFRPSRMDGRGMDEPKMLEGILEALNAVIALDGNRRHRHHRRSQPSEVKAMMARDVPRGWEAKKIPPGSLQKSKLLCSYNSLNVYLTNL